jgi:glyoxylase-like metal-dependent hydrolase (beta-lactamase superfamily II)
MSTEDPNAESTSARSGKSPTSRRKFLTGTGVAAAGTAAATLLSGPLAGTALAAAPGAKPKASKGSPTYAPIPESALGPTLNAQGYYVGQIKGDLYWVTDGAYQAMFLTTNEGVVLVDAPATIGVNLQRAINDVTKVNGRPNKVTHLIHSHSHSDHIGASVLFGSDVVRIGHHENRTLLLRDNDPNRPAPTLTFKDHYTLEVGGEILQLDYHGPNHTPDTIFIWAPAQRALMLVDVVFPGWVPWKNLAISQDIPDWIKAQDIALQYPFQTLVAGHLGRLGTRADTELQIAYVNDLLTEARKTVDTLDATPLFAQYGNNAWAIYKAYLDEASAQIAAPVTQKYLGKLAAADVFTLDNAFTIFEFAVREDGGMQGPFGIRYT